MKRLILVTVTLALGACGSGGDTDSMSASPAENDVAPGVFGRWDVTVTGEDSYPMWFELRDENGTVKGSMQGRTGNALPMENLHAMGMHVMWNMGGTAYHSNLEGEEIHGSGTREDGTTFDWVAVRAPELPAPASVTWGEPVELFNGEDLTGFRPRDDEAPNQWAAEDGVLVNRETGSDLVTEASFWNFQLHAEVNVPEGGNSGIYLRGRYEVQVQDDHGKEPHSLHMGGIYGQVTPMSNPALPAGEWQTFDITLLGRFVTVVLNGETIIDNQEIPGTTGGALDSNEGEPGPIFLQGDHGRILYRNLVLTPAN